MSVLKDLMTIKTYIDINCQQEKYGHSEVDGSPHKHDLWCRLSLSVTGYFNHAIL